MNLVAIWLAVLLESGLFLFFLPGDSLLFSAGLLSAQGLFGIYPLIFGSLLSAIIGNTAGYLIGLKLGPKVLSSKRLVSASKFYKKHGDITILLARFVPVIRTFAPLVAGAVKMNFTVFLTYNIIGALLWVLLFVNLGYYFGNIPLIRNHFMTGMFLIIVISIIPMALHLYKRK